MIGDNQPQQQQVPTVIIKNGNEGCVLGGIGILVLMGTIVMTVICCLGLLLV